MTSRVRIYNRVDGRLLADARTTAGRTWKLGEVGKATFSLAETSAWAAAEIIRHRNLVYITHDNGLPAWCGFLFTPRTHDDEAGTVQLTAWYGERLLKFRRSEGLTQVKGTAGDIFAQLVRLANKREDMRVRVGDVWSGGKTFAYKLGETASLYEDIQKLAAMSGCEWGVEASLEPNGNLAFAAHFWRERGAGLQTAILEQGQNFEANAQVLTEQGDLVNDLRVTGNGAETGAARAEAWIREYGLIEGTASYSAEKTPDTLKVFAEETVSKEARGRNTYRIRVTNKNGLFASVRLGNQFVTKFPRLNRVVTTRVLGMQYPDDDEYVDLTVDEVLK